MRIVDYDVDVNGELVEVSSDARIDIIGEVGIGINAPKIADINGVRGFLKESKNTTNTFDKFEYIVAKLGKYLGIKMADEYLIRDGDNLSMFSKSVVNNDEELIMASRLGSEIVGVRDIPKEVQMEEIQKREDFMSQLEKVGNVESPKLKANSEQIDYAIGSFIERVKFLGLPNEEEIIKDYVKMCFFDALIGNKDRNTNNFGLVKGTDGSYKFAPLFDSSGIAMPKIDYELCQVNDYMMDRRDLLRYLLNKYPDYMNEIFDHDIEETGEKITKISKAILNEKEYEWFNSSVLNKLNNSIFEMIKTQSF